MAELLNVREARPKTERGSVLQIVATVEAFSDWVIAVSQIRFET